MVSRKEHKDTQRVFLDLIASNKVALYFQQTLQTEAMFSLCVFVFFVGNHYASHPEVSTTSH
jgi:hypothetical protein